MAADYKRVFVVGGGFSYHAGLPLTSNFTEALVSVKYPDTGLSGALVRHLGKFIMATFGHTLQTPENWPNLEDLFTCIDLAANTGHHLGNSFSAAELRTVRRCLIVRIIRMLKNRHDRAARKKDEKWKRLKQLLTNVDYKSSAFVSMNWDEVIENRFRLTHTDDLDYGCDAIQVRLSPDKRRIIQVDEYTNERLKIVKIHGSTNWLYCDNCQKVFWLLPNHGHQISERLLSTKERRKIAPGRKSQVRQWDCPFCRKVKLSTRLATFSYRKALDFPMFQKSWFTAEELLRGADTWAFIGYSLPAADYEFKYLLKKIQLSRRVPPRIIVVTGGEDAVATYKTYQQFFGQTLKTGTNCFLEGLDTKSNECLLNC